MQETKPELLTGEVFERISKQWMLITAGPEKNCNTMTASWGGLGILWGKPVSTIYIRPQADKFEACGLHRAEAACGAAYVAEAELVLVCRKLYWQDMDPDHFLVPEIAENCYPQKDYHRIYIGEIVQALTNA